MLHLGFNHKSIAPPKRPDALTTYEIGGEIIPLYNTRATIVPCLDSDCIFVFGGFDELDNLDSNVYLLNMATKSWEIDDKHIGLYREGHLAVYIGQGNVLVFGGIPHDEFPESTQSNPESTDAIFRKDSLMMIYNIQDKKWIGPPKFALENAPSSRYRHACCLSPDGSKLYISGGLVNSMPLDDLYCYDLALGRWQGPIKFVSRFDHYIKVYDNKLFTFGGLDKDMNHVIDCMTYLSLTDHSINKVSLLQKSILNESPEENNSDHVNEYPFPTSGGSKFERIYTSAISCPTKEIEICLPLINTLQEYSISYYDLQTLLYTPLINKEIINVALKLKDKETYNYLWKHAFLAGPDSLFLLGLRSDEYEDHHESENENDEDDMTTLSERDDDNDDDELLGDQNQQIILDDSTKLHSLLEIKLSDLGLSNYDRLSPTLASDFYNLLINEEFTDFEIIVFKDESIMEEHNKFPDKYSEIIHQSMSGQREITDILHSIKVHKSILLGRWKHFKRLIASGMTEAVSNKMFIPEPYAWVKGLIFYLYTDTIHLSEPICTLEDYSGILILSNLYEIPLLRTQVLGYLYKELNYFIIDSEAKDIDEEISSILKIWTNGLISNETILVAKIIEIIRSHWSIIIKSKSFSALPKSLIIKLCQDCVDVFPDRNFFTTENISGTDLMLQAQDSNKASNDSIENLHCYSGSNLGTPTSGSMRELHSNSPFLKTTNDQSPVKVPLPNSSEAANFPTLQYLSNVLSDKLQE